MAHRIIEAAARRATQALDYVDRKTRQWVKSGKPSRIRLAGLVYCLIWPASVVVFIWDECGDELKDAFKDLGHALWYGRLRK